MDEYLGMALVVLFGTLFGLVVPLWLLLHYWSKRRTHLPAGPDEQARLQRLALQIDRLRQRVRALEAILDSQSPGWRDDETSVSDISRTDRHGR